ncbi:MAG: hypothetical protein WD512_20805 [Candidatus Paceibacterota bacterium]
MGTASGITIKVEKDKCLHVYNHCDGDLHGAGKTLNNNYTSLGRVKELVEKGNISLLRPYLHPDPDKPQGWEDFAYNRAQGDVCRFYTRDRGDEGEGAMELSHRDEAPDYEHNYYFNGKIWLYRAEGKKRWENLENLLIKKGITN